MCSASRVFLEFATPSRHKISLDRLFDFRCIVTTNLMFEN